MLWTLWPEALWDSKTNTTTPSRPQDVIGADIRGDDNGPNLHIALGMVWKLERSGEWVLHLSAGFVQTSLNWHELITADLTILSLWGDVQKGLNPGVLLDYLIEHNLTKNGEKIEEAMASSNSYERKFLKNKCWGNLACYHPYRS